MTGIHRLAVNINDEAADALRRVTALRGYSVTEAVRRAIALLDYMEERKRQLEGPGAS